MRRPLQLVAAIVLAVAGLSAQGRLLDKIAAVVNGTPILQSDIDADTWFQYLSAHLADPHAPTPAALAPADTAATLQRLIGQRLLLQDATDEDYGPAPTTQVTAQWNRLEALAGGPAPLAGALADFHLTAAAVRALILQQLSIVNYLDQHLGETVSVTGEQIQTYYDREFVPAARARNIVPAPLAAVRSTIETILRQRQIDAAQTQLLDQLRQRAHIEMQPGGTP